MGKRKPTVRKATKKPRQTPQQAAKALSVKLSQRLARLDRDLLEAINQRAKVAVALAKSQTGFVSTKNGDSDVRSIDSLLQRKIGPLPESAVRAVFRELTSACRRLSQPNRVGFLGPLFSYSHQAALERFGSSSDLVPLGTIGAVFEEVASGNVDFGIVPLENSTDGRIADTLDMFTRVHVRITGEVSLRIHHQLLGKGPREGIRQVCSKPQALSQCRAWLAEHVPLAELKETSSTTAAAEMCSKDPTKAAIASCQAGLHYGLDVLAANVEDNRDNVTRFAVLGQMVAEKTGDDKTAMLFQVRHQPGALADVMNIFKKNRLNLTWIESFPLHDRNNEYFFFAELQGHERELRVRRAIAALGKKTDVLEVLGSYAATATIE